MRYKYYLEGIRSEMEKTFSEKLGGLEGKIIVLSEQMVLM